MHKFVRNLLTEWRKLSLPFADKTILIAVSGGADSVSLALALSDLHKAKKLKLNFIVVHFNHNLRGAESEKDAQFVKDLAEKLKFEFISEIQNPEFKIQNQRDNLEQSARKARYKFLAQAAQKYNAHAVLTAHTLNDQAETFLLNLLRGSGSCGLGAMKTVRKIDEKSEVLLVRPMLNWAKREATESFCKERGIKFRRDAMNEDLAFSRVRIRKKLIPLLQQFNPKIIETLSRTADLLRAEAEQLSVANYQLPEDLNLKDLKPLSKSMLYRVLRNWLKKERGSLRRLELIHLEAIERLIYSRKSGKKVELPNGETILKKQGKLFFEKSKVEKSRFAD